VNHPGNGASMIRKTPKKTDIETKKKVVGKVWNLKEIDKAPLVAESG
jgi:hypothetical protein